MIAYTDGITEALNPLGEQYGIERMVGIIENAPPQDAQSLIECISDDLEEFASGAPKTDDVILMVLVVVHMPMKDISGK